MHIFQYVSSVFSTNSSGDDDILMGNDTKRMVCIEYILHNKLHPLIVFVFCKIFTTYNPIRPTTIFFYPIHAMERNEEIAKLIWSFDMCEVVAIVN